MDNPRPPTGFFSSMRPIIAKQYPRRSRKVQNKIIAGIFWKYPEETQKRIIKEFDSASTETKIESKNPKVEMLECPCCHTANPVAKAGVFLKCTKCKKNLVSVKIRHK
jgi:hypothetical protein